MKTTKKEINPKYVDLCEYLEIPVKLALECRATYQDLKDMAVQEQARFRGQYWQSDC